MFDHRHVLVPTGRDIGDARGQLVPIAGLTHADGTAVVKAARKGAGEPLGHVLGHDYRRRSHWKIRQNTRQRLNPARGRADRDHPIAVVFRRSHLGIGRQVVDVLAQLAQARHRRRLHAPPDFDHHIGQSRVRSDHGFGNHIDRAGLKRLNRDLRTAPRHGRDHHGRNCAVRHVGLEKTDPIHSRHFDVQRDHVGPLGLKHPRRHLGRGRRAHNFDPGVFAQTQRQNPSDHGGIIDDQHLDRWVIRHQPSLR